MSRWLRCATLAAAVLSASSLGRAQAPAGGAFDTAYLPADRFAVAVLAPRRALLAKELDTLPLELISAGGLQEFGVDPLEIEQAVIGFAAPKESQGKNLRVGAVLRFANPAKLDLTKLARHFGELKPAATAGKNYFQGSAPDSPSLWLSDDRKTAVLAHEAVLLEMLAAQKPVDGPLAKLLKAYDGSDDAYMAGTLEPIRDEIKKELAQSPAASAPPLEALKKLPELMADFEVRFNVRPKLKSHVSARGRDEKSAVEMARILDGALDYARQQALDSAVSGDLTDPVNQATQRYMQRITNHYLKLARPIRTGDRLTTALGGPDAVTQGSIAVALMLPALQAARGAAQRTESMNGLKQIGIALHNYHAIHRKFPPRTSLDKQGKPLLSWRVHLLPLLDQMELYNKFRLDEPWDSPANRELILQMPEVYGRGGAEGKTNLLAVAGKGAAFGGADGITIAQIRDGTTNTVLVVEADNDRAVIWTKPADFEPTAENPWTGLGGLRPGGVNALFADGHVEFLKNTIDAAQLRALFTISGAEPVPARN